MRQLLLFAGAGTIGGTTVTAIQETMKEPDIREVIRRIAPNCCKVEGKNSQGSGVILAGGYYILTNAHITERNALPTEQWNDPSYNVRMYNGHEEAKTQEFKAFPVMLSSGERAHTPLSSGYDLSLLRVPPDVEAPFGVTIRDIEANPLVVGETAIAIGTPRGSTDNVSKGIISHTHRRWEQEPNNIFIAYDTPTNPGNSGSGVFDTQGRLIAIHTAGIPGADGMGIGIRADVIRHILEQWNIR